MGRWPEGPFVQSRNDEFSKIEICDFEIWIFENRNLRFWNLDFPKLTISIFRNWTFRVLLLLQKLQQLFEVCLMLSLVRKWAWQTDTRTDTQTHAHHQFWGSSTQKALRATRLHPHCSFWSNGNGWSRRITVDPGDNYRHSRKFVILTCRLQIDRPIFEPPKSFKMCQFVSIRYLK